jgi:hypothetical protein
VFLKIAVKNLAASEVKEDERFSISGVGVNSESEAKLSSFSQMPCCKL